MSDRTDALVVSIYTALEAALSCPVYNYTPTDAAMPYVVIDTVQAVPNETLQARRDEVFVYLTAWTKYRGSKQANELVATIYSTLHRAKLSMSTGRMVRAYVTARGSEPDIQDEIFKGRATVRCLIEH